ncbi:thioredoxin I [Cordyceps militaris]|uniref:Thioredoxin I n=1 Tax=Cordyceps militaris TaxID=73501 RepID=A0A2H4SV66_CORMI|nr:thioredoxin I [Cordyceps militaris]
MLPFHLGPKPEDREPHGKRYHAKDSIRPSDGTAPSVLEYEERDTGIAPTSMILIRILIAKVKKRKRLEAVLRAIPKRAGHHIGWECLTNPAVAFDAAAVPSL